MALDLIPPSLIAIAGNPLNGQVQTMTDAGPAYAWRGWVGRSIATLDERVEVVNKNVPGDDSLPQATEMQLLLSVSHTPRAAGHLLRISGFLAHVQLGVVASVTGMVALFRNEESDAAAASLIAFEGAHNLQARILLEQASSGSDPVTYRLGIGCVGQNRTLYVNGNSSSRLFGGVLKSLLIVDEFAP